MSETKDKLIAQVRAAKKAHDAAMLTFDLEQRRATKKALEAAQHALTHYREANPK